MREPEDPERRIRKRKTASTLAWADPGGVLPVIDCKILDLTEEGARVSSPSGSDFPQIFQLQVDATHILGAAEVIWREYNQVGVRFLTRV
jgi:hypothetical protein